MFDYIAQLTDNNLHTEAYIEGCEFLGETALVEQLNDIKHVHYKLGHLTPVLDAQRYEIYKEMKASAAKQMDTEFFNDFISNF